ncbi:MAG TPA: thioesterase family protein [Acidimicrobiales bacterium]|nr:thioesterase family protein [Acidimicrobiales bacterium]
MGDLGTDTAVEQIDDNRYSAKLNSDWRIWGPQGGYIASVALRAAGAASPFARPASFSCHFLGVADFDEVELTVAPLRVARTACSQRVELTQGGRTMLEATVWSVGDVDGLEHDVSEAPDVPGPDGLPTLDELLANSDDPGPSFSFWNNFVCKPITFRTDWPPAGPLPPVWQRWHQFAPTATFDDSWIDACRSLVLIDVQSWPSASPQHAYADHGFIAPSLDLYVAFHDPRPQSAWLLSDGHGPVARDGLMGWNGRLWSEDGALVASGTGQMLCRRVRTPPS